MKCFFFQKDNVITFVQISKYICSNCTIWRVGGLLSGGGCFGELICVYKPLMYLSKLENVFVQFSKCISSNFRNVFVQIAL